MRVAFLPNLSNQNNPLPRWERAWVRVTNQIWKFRQIAVILIIGLMFFSPQARAEATFPVPVTTEVRTLKRLIDPIVIRMGKFPGFPGEKIGPLRLMAVRNGAWEVIPFQVDEVDKNGEYIFPIVYKNGSFQAAGAGKGQGIVSSRDELVFISRDLGDRAKGNQWPASPGMEIEVRDPLEGGRGYAYLFRFPETPPLSPRDYVDIGPDGKLILTEEYVFGFTDPVHPAVFNLAAFFARGASRNIEESRRRNILDRLKIRATIRFLGGKIRMSWDETDPKSELIAYLDGPVRVIQKYRYWVDLVLGIPSPSIGRLVYSYPNRTVLPNDMYLPFNPDAFVTDGAISVALDFTRHAVGSYLYNPILEKPVLIDGKMSPEEKMVSDFTIALSEKLAPWVLFYNPEGAVLGRLLLSDKIWNEFHRLEPRGTFRYSFFYTDDAAASDDPGLEPGKFGEFGFQGKGKADVQQGHYYASIIFFGKRGFTFGEQGEFLQVDDNPLEVTIR